MCGHYDYPHPHQTMMVEGLWREGGHASCIVLKHSFGESVA